MTSTIRVIAAILGGIIFMALMFTAFYELTRSDGYSGYLQANDENRNIEIHGKLHYCGVSKHTENVEITVEGHTQIYSIPCSNLDQDKPVHGPCIDRPGDEGALLHQVCEYIVANQIPVTQHPNYWSIAETKETITDRNPSIAVYLSCCYTGDVAYFDKGTKKLVNYFRGNE